MKPITGTAVPPLEDPTSQQLPLSALVGAVKPNPTPEKGVWRQVLTATKVTGTAHHVGWILYGRSNQRGRVPPVSYQALADDSGISTATVKRGLADGERRGAWRRRGRRTKGGNIAPNAYDLNLGGRFTVGHTDPRPWVTQTQQDLGLPYVGQSKPTAVADPPAREGAQEQQQPNQRRIEGLLGAVASRARQLGHDFDEIDERRRLAAGEIDVAALQALADDLDAELAEQGDVRRHRIVPGLDGGGSCSVCGRRTPPQTELCPGRPRRSRIQALAEDCADVDRRKERAD